MKYQTLLLDADNTLLDFQKAEARGIEAAFQAHCLPFSPEILALYSEINRRCWEEYERGQLDRDRLLIERFCRLFRQIDVEADAGAVALSYRDELGKGAYLIEGAREVCEELGKTADLYIITNGVAATQYSRFAASGLDKLVKRSFISEEIGYQKPRREFFAYVFAAIPDFHKDRTLVVGDSLTADIQGGIQAGVDTCWYNPRHVPRPEAMQITYEIDDIRKLREIVA